MGKERCEGKCLPCFQEVGKERQVRLHPGLAGQGPLTCSSLIHLPGAALPCLGQPCPHALSLSRHSGRAWRGCVFFFPASASGISAACWSAPSRAVSLNSFSLGLPGPSQAGGAQHSPAPGEALEPCSSGPPLRQQESPWPLPSSSWAVPPTTISARPGAQAAGCPPQMAETQSLLLWLLPPCRELV